MFQYSPQDTLALASTPSVERANIISIDSVSRRITEDQSLLSTEARRIARAVSELDSEPGHEHISPRALVVGGFVRDGLIGVESKDLDLEVYGVSAKRLDALLELLYPGKVNRVGDAFCVLKVNLGSGVDIDVSIPRRESKKGTGHRDFEIQGDPFLSIEDAARRRDFTMNAVAADLLSGELIDLFGGIEDLKKGILKVTDPERFIDDPLRVYRAVQFVGRFGLEVDPNSLSLLHQMVDAGELEHLKSERITEEIKKLLLKSEKPSVGFELMRALGITEKYMPELHALLGVEQEPEWHPEGDVWIHTMMVVDQAARLIRLPTRSYTEEEKLQVLISALCHDFGKPATTEVSEGRIRSIGHEAAGVEPVQSFLRRFNFGQSLEHAAVTCAQRHLVPGTLLRQLENGTLNDTGYRRAVATTCRKIFPLSTAVFLTVSESDSRGRTIPGCEKSAYLPGIRFAEIVARDGLEQSGRSPLLKGRDLIELGLTPGPNFGRLIEKVESLRDLGQIGTREEAIEYIKQTHDMI